MSTYPYRAVVAEQRAKAISFALPPKKQACSSVATLQHQKSTANNGQYDSQNCSLDE
jgi:hypothetical protein